MQIIEAAKIIIKSSVIGISILLVMTFALWAWLSYFGLALGVFIGVGVSVLAGFWIRWSIVRLGTDSRPMMAVITQFGRPIRSVGPGLYFIPKWIQGLARYPMEAYTFAYTIFNVYTKEISETSEATGALRTYGSAGLTVNISITFRWPRPEEEVGLTFPGIFNEDEARNSSSHDDHTGLKDGWKFKSVGGAESLKDGYTSFPFHPPTSVTPDQLSAHFEGAFTGGVRRMMAVKNHLQIRQEKGPIEDAVIGYVLSEPANTLHDLHIPAQCLAIEITRIQFPDEMDKAFIASETAQRTGEARVVAAKAGQESAAADGARIAELTKAYTDQGVNPDLAGLYASSGSGGEGGESPRSGGGLSDIVSIMTLRLLAGLARDDDEEKGPRRRRGGR